MIDKASAEEILYKDVKSIDKLSVYDDGISDLSGIEYFTALTYLDCGFNELTTLDVSKNIALADLSCDTNQLTNLDLSKNIKLEYLSCEDNQLKTLYSIKNTWDEDDYKDQYTDASHTTQVNNLIITIKN